MEEGGDDITKTNAAEVAICEVMPILQPYPQEPTQSQKHYKLKWTTNFCSEKVHTLWTFVYQKADALHFCNQKADTRNFCSLKKQAL